MNSFGLIEYRNFLMHTKSVSIKDIYLLPKSPCDFYLAEKSTIKLVIRQNSEISKEYLKKLLLNKHWYLLTPNEEYQNLLKAQTDHLKSISRSLSIGNTEQNIKQLLTYLALGINHLYEVPDNDMLLSAHSQGLVNLCYALEENKQIIPELFSNFQSQKHYYLSSHPILSSLMLIGLLQDLKLFSIKEVESLVLASYFKDIGMSLIPSPIHDKKDLSEAEKNLIRQHSEFSGTLLNGRLNVGPQHIDLIRNHHIHGILGENESSKTMTAPLVGAESVFLMSSDMLTAMISARPFREALDLYNALEKVRPLMANEYTQEFKALVLFCKKFFAPK